MYDMTVLVRITLQKHPQPYTKFNQGAKHLALDSMLSYEMTKINTIFHFCAGVCACCAVHVFAFVPFHSLFFSPLQKMSSSIFCVTYRLKEKQRKKEWKKGEKEKCAPYHKCDTQAAVNRSLCWRSFKSVIFVTFFCLYSPPLLPIKCVIHTLDTLLQAVAVAVAAVANLLFCSQSHTLILFHPSVQSLPCSLILYISRRCVAMSSLRSRSFVYLLRLYHITYLSLWHLTCVLALNWNEWPECVCVRVHVCACACVCVCDVWVLLVSAVYYML